jgi:hypothetical protein
MSATWGDGWNSHPLRPRSQRGASSASASVTPGVPPASRTPYPALQAGASPFGLRDEVAPPEGLEPSSTVLETVSAPRLGGNGSPPRARTWSGRVNSAVPVPIRVVGNGKWSGLRGSNPPLRLGRPRQSPDYEDHEWCRPSGSNGDPALFRRVHEPSLLERRVCLHRPGHPAESRILSFDSALRAGSGRGLAAVLHHPLVLSAADRPQSKDAMQRSALATRCHGRSARTRTGDMSLMRAPFCH